MRSPLDSVRLDCGINRISVSHGDRPILAVPLDNRHVKLYDLTGSRLAHLPRRQRQVRNLQHCVCVLVSFSICCSVDKQKGGGTSPADYYMLT